MPAKHRASSDLKSKRKAPSRGQPSKPEPTPVKTVSKSASNKKTPPAPVKRSTRGQKK